MKAIQKYTSVFFAFVALCLLSSAASAAVPTEVTDMITALVTDVGTLFAACVALWVAIRSSTAIMRLGNRFIGKAGG